MAYLAPSLARLRTEINATYPGRDRTSDGWIGDASHQARPSDHNPDPPVIGVVRAIDVDVDGVSELDIISAVLRHPATNYVIFNGRIAQRVNGFAWRTYTGTNPHDKHFHVSIRRGYEQDGTPWLNGGGGGSTVSNPGVGTGTVPTSPTVTKPKPISPLEPEEEADMKPWIVTYPGTKAMFVLSPDLTQKRHLHSLGEVAALKAAGAVETTAFGRDTIDQASWNRCHDAFAQV